MVEALIKAWGAARPKSLPISIQSLLRNVYHTYASDESGNFSVHVGQGGSLTVNPGRASHESSLLTSNPKPQILDPKS